MEGASGGQVGVGGTSNSGSSGGGTNGQQDEKTECQGLAALCNGHCFTELGEEKNGCRLIRRLSSAANDLDGAFDPRFSEGVLYFGTIFGLSKIDLTTLEESVLVEGEVGDYAVASGTLLYSSPDKSVTMHTLDGGEKAVLTSSLGGKNFQLVGDHWYFSSSSDSLLRVPKTGGTLEELGQPADDFVVLGDVVYAAEGSYFGQTVVRYTAGSGDSVEQISEHDSEVTMLEATDQGITWFADGGYHRYSAASSSVTPLDLGDRSPHAVAEYGVVTVQRNADLRHDEFYVLDLASGASQLIATVEIPAQTYRATVSSTHLFVAAGKGSIFEVAR